MSSFSSVSLGIVAFVGSIVSVYNIAKSIKSSNEIEKEKYDIINKSAPFNSFDNFKHNELNNLLFSKSQMLYHNVATNSCIIEIIKKQNRKNYREYSVVDGFTTSSVEFGNMKMTTTEPNITNFYTYKNMKVKKSVFKFLHKMNLGLTDMTPPSYENILFPNRCKSVTKYSSVTQLLNDLKSYDKDIMLDENNKYELHKMSLQNEKVFMYGHYDIYKGSFICKVMGINPKHVMDKVYEYEDNYNANKLVLSSFGLAVSLLYIPFLFIKE